MNIDFKNDEILFLEGETGIVGIAKVAYENKMLFIATQDNEEIVQFLESDDIIAVSNFKKDKRAIRSQAYLSREESSPLIILNKDHPSTKRLETVISIGDRVNLNCNIIPGTHPEQNILCSCDSLSGLEIIKTPTGVKLNKDHPSTKRLETVISIGDGVNLNCNIIPGTHPEQNILCSCDSLSGLEIVKTPTGVKLNKEFDNYTIEEF